VNRRNAKDHTRGSFKLFPESLIINAKLYNHLSFISFRIVSPCATINSCRRLWRCGEHSWKPFCERLYRSSVVFIMMPVVLHKRRLFNADFVQRNRHKTAAVRSGKYRGCSIVVTFFLTTNNRCARALSWRRNRLLVLQCSRRFLLTTFLRRRRTSMNFLYSQFYRNFPHGAIPVNYFSKFL